MKTQSIIMIFIFISGFASFEVSGVDIRLNDDFYRDTNPKNEIPAAISGGSSDSLTIIGNYVWRDLNINGIQDSSDFPLKGVRIELVRYDSNKVVASTISNAQGKYEFIIDSNVEPGIYFLRFLPFDRFVPTIIVFENEELDSDIDENAMTDTFYLPSEHSDIDFDAGFYLTYHDDFDCESFEISFECTEADIYSFADLNNSCFSMYPAWQTMPIPGCGSGYAFHNPAWFGFIAADSVVDFLIHAEYCISEGDNTGLQWGVYDNCDMSNMIAGSCPCIEPKEIFVNLNGLVEGKTYYLFIDGCSGTMCYFWLEWLTGYCNDEVTGIGSISCNGEDIDCEYFCGDKSYTLNVDGIENADKYTWKVGDEIIETENPLLELKFKKSGYITISVFGSNNCSIGDPYSTKVFVFDTIYGNLGKVSAIPEQLETGFLPPGWLGPELTKYGKDSVLVVNSFGCGQWQFIEVVENPDYINLIAFYNATNGHEWNNNSGWKEGADSTNCDPCNGWYGVKCQDARVTTIELRENNLYGKIPKELYNLSELKYLALNDNELYGVLPDSIRKLKNLEYLNLGNNNYSTSVPQDISNLHNLKYLYLNGNQFYLMNSGIFKMMSLVNLDVSNNNLSGEIPDYINMSNLENLNLSNNNFFGKIPVELGDCLNLKSLMLTKNRFTGSIHNEISQLNMLWRLDLSENQLNGTIPENLVNLNNLTVLQINDNNLEGEIFDQIKDLKKLIYLYCDNNNFTGTIDSEIGMMKNLRYISASNNSFKGQLPVELFISGLSYLDLRRNNFTGKVPAEIGNSIYLSHLDLSFNNFYDTLPKEIGKLKDLNNLSLNDNDFSGSIPKEIGKLRKLQYLNLKNNQFEGSIPSEIGGMYSLIDFNASNNELTGSLPPSIGYLSQLTTLVLNHNSLTGSVPKEMISLKKIKKINLKDNNLSGCYPEELKQFCKPTKTIIFNNNKLLPWEGDFYRFCATDDQIGAPCNDGDDSNGTNDKIDVNCNCVGTVASSDALISGISYNNPVTDYLRINSEIDMDAIEIFDINGTLVKGYMDIKSPFYEIDLSDFSGGIYLMKIIISDKQRFFKLIKI